MVRATNPAEPKETSSKRETAPTERTSEPLSPRFNGRESLFLSAALVLATTFAVFCQVPNFDFVSWDDCIHVYQNPYFQTYTIGELGHFWRHSYQSLYIPLSYTVFGLLSLAAHRSAPDPRLTDTGAPLDPHLFHTANLLLHAINVLLVFFLLRRFTRKDLASAGGTLVFAIHPLQVESVAWISELRGLLGAAFSLTSIHLYLNFADTRGNEKAIGGKLLYWLSVLAACCGMLSKPSYVIVGPVIAVIGLYTRNRSIKSATLEALPYCAAGIVLVLVTAHVQPTSGNEVVTLWRRSFIAGDALTFYLWKFVWPVDLAIDYGRRPTWVLAHWWAYLEWAVPVAIGLVVWKVRTKAPYVLFGSAVALLAILPVIGLTPFVFQLKSTVADRYMYFPLLGASMVVSYSIASVSISKRLIAGVCLTLWILALCYLSFRQTMTWRDSEALYYHAVSINPGSGVSQNGLGNELENRKMYSAAADHYLIAVEDDPSNISYQTNLGQEYLLLGNIKRAEQVFRRLTAAAPWSAEGHRDLGVALLDQGNGPEGITALSEALTLNPTDEAASEYMGGYFMGTRDYATAIDVFRNGLKYHTGSNTLWRGLGLALYDAGRRREALQPLAMALHIDPSDQTAMAAFNSIVSPPH